MPKNGAWAQNIMYKYKIPVEELDFEKDLPCCWRENSDITPSGGGGGRRRSAVGGSGLEEKKNGETSSTQDWFLVFFTIQFSLSPSFSQLLSFPPFLFLLDIYPTLIHSFASISDFYFICKLHVSINAYIHHTDYICLLRLTEWNHILVFMWHASLN